MASTPFVTVAGVAIGKVMIDSPTEDEPEVQGTFRRGDDGGVQTSERSPKRGFAMVIKFDPPADFDTLRDAISAAGMAGVPTAVSVTSPADGLTRGVSLTCYARLGRAQIRSKGAGASKTTYLTAPLTLKEA